ncbi:MAG: enoyl-CoA hydratase/isomerase family protein [Phycisphaerales bacterium]|jgi:enoyl-CoA hydratase/carnithine racemase|nr:enoyl-CoA hydratase/isomerase family protein [Phycisphaerales bacterium]
MPTKQDHLATLEFAPPRAVLTLHRPDARNALSRDLLDALHARLDELHAREDCHVLTLTGEGRAFCAGMDLRAVLGSEGDRPDIESIHAMLSSLASLTLKIRDLHMVVVAKVNGAAIGGGCGLACVADLCITHADSKMGYPEVDLGVCPAVVAPWLVAKVGPGRARAMLLRGGVMSGREAHERGLVDVLADDRAALDTTTDALVTRLAAGGPNALAMTKRLLNDLDGSGIGISPDLLARAARLSADLFASPDAQKRLRAAMG